MNLASLKISSRLAIAFGVMVLLMTALNGATLVNASLMEDKLTLIMRQRLPALADGKALQEEVNAQASALATMPQLPSKDAIAKERAAVLATRERISALIERLKDEAGTPDAKELFAAVTETRTAWRQSIDAFMAMVDADDKRAASAYLVATLRPMQARLLAQIGAMNAPQSTAIDKAGADAFAGIAGLRAVTYGIAAVALLAAVALGLWIVRSTTRPINRAVDVADAVARGDLTVSIDASADNETGRLMKALKAMQTKLVGVVGDMRQNADAVATASSEIAHGNQDLSQRTEQQASALEETAASMEELGTTVRQNADNAKQANQLALGASTVAKRGGEVVGRVVDTMKGINDSSKKIADIIGTIDGIAFQTNILALNAAVEAARAGEQGRGFAVVAGEVRSLAQRSAEAAKEIKGLIAASVERVEQGSQLVDQAGATMTEIVDAIRRVTDIVGEISSASAEQSTGVAQIGEAVTQMDRTTQQNAALVEQSAAAAESLRSQAGRMVETVAGFTLPSGKAAAAKPAPATAPAAPAKAAPPVERRAVRPDAKASTPARTPAVTATAPAMPPAAAAPARVERRGPNRATNVVRPAFGAGDDAPKVEMKPPIAAAGGSDEWETF